jgi:hypothetical protein
MYPLIALLAGAAAKLYDDLEDNNLLQEFRNNTFMEFLKGLHYITFTTVSVEEPLFFIIQYVMNIAHCFANKEGYSKPYEHSLLYSFFLLFIIIDYKKITSSCIIDILQSILFILGMIFEPIAMKILCENSEYSFIKLIFRCFLILCASILLYFFTKSNRYIIAYYIGYMFVSVLVQLYSLIYSLIMEKLKIEKEDEKEKEKEKEKEEVKEKEKEEVEEVEEVEEKVKEKEKVEEVVEVEKEKEKVEKEKEKVKEDKKKTQ